MSARPAFADSSTYRPCTTFAGGVNLWTKETMTAPTPITAHLGSSPFIGHGHTPAKKAGPPKGTLCRGKVDMAGLKIVKNLPLPVTLTTSSYAQRFSKMEPKDAIECKPEEVVPVANAMRKWLKDNGKITEFQVVSEKHDPANSKVGHVWLWPMSDIKELPSKSRGGVVLGQKRRSAKA